MNILVTGGAGYIGSITCKELTKRGHNVIVYDNFTNSRREYAKWGHVIEGDLLNREKLTQVLKSHSIAAVFHFAALIEVGESVKFPEKFHRNNVQGTTVLLDCMKASGTKHIVFSSSCATYGNAEKIPITETNTQAPVSVYGETKLLGERMMIESAERGELFATILRYFNAAGADPEGEAGECHDPETHLLPLVIQAAKDPSFSLKVFGSDYPTADGTCIRDYTHVTDLAVAHAQALDWSVKTQTPWEAFNLGSGKGSSVLEVISAVERLSQSQVKYEVHPRREGDADILVADISKARSLLGWEPVHSNLEQVVKTAIHWHSKK